MSRPERHDLALVVSLVAGAALIAGALLLVVTVRTEQVRVGYRVHDLQSELLRLEQDRAALDVERAQLLRPSRLASLARARGLAPVTPAQLHPNGGAQ